MKSTLRSGRGKSKSAVAEARRPVAPTERKPVRGTHVANPEVVPDLDMEWLREANETSNEVDLLADRVFSSVLQRCGWQRNERGEIEHVGEGRD